MKTKSLILIALFAALTAVGGFIRIPLPYVPFTLQILSVFLSGALLGPKLGMMSQLIYVLAGLAGAPIFTKGGGPEYIFQPTFGYLIGFILGAFTGGWVAQKLKSARLHALFLANFSCLVVVYFIGWLWLYGDMNYIMSTPITLKQAFIFGCLIPIPGDLILCVLCSILSARMMPIIKPRFSIQQQGVIKK
ncbi:biotin transporter BioY [Scopulibacillus daqui]|uniref:ECF transporter S component n=1 Tax=Scopulibacillus daqui TaxID=1469162 RepID=UPI0019622695